MIKKQATIFPFSGEENPETQITIEDACRILHNLSMHERTGVTLICESNDEQTQLVTTYYKMYHDDFNVQHYIKDEEQQDLQLAYPAETDVFYVENMYYRFEAGIRELDSRYARINTHQTIFNFNMTPIFEYFTAHNASNKQEKTEVQQLKQYVIHKHEQLNHLSYECAQEYLEYIWSLYREFFQDNINAPDLEKIIAVNKSFNLPWYYRI